MTRRSVKSAAKNPANVSELDTVDARVKHIMRLMTEGKFLGMRSRMELAETWGLGLYSINDYANEAHRRLNDVGPDTEQLRREFHERLLDVAKRAAECQNRMTGMYDFQAEIKALETAARFGKVDENTLAADKQAARETRIRIKLEREESSKSDSPQADSAQSEKIQPETKK